MLQTIHNSGVYTVDALYYQANLASIHLVRSGNQIAVVDTGTQHSISQIKQALDELNLTWNNIDYIILTHIHLDHAGGAGALMALCENAKLVVHPKGARHMVDPTKLIAGAQAVYGKTEFDKLYGTITAIAHDRIIEPSDGQTIDLAGRPLTFIDTPGHANHHHCISDPFSNAMFTGDTLGVGYPALRTDTQAFVMPTTTPVQFNPDALHRSIDKVMSYQPQTLYLTHYSAIHPNAQLIAGLHEQIDDYVMLTEQAADHEDDFETVLTSTLTDYRVRRCMNELEGITEEVVRHWVSLDAGLNAQGLVFWWLHRRS